MANGDPALELELARLKSFTDEADRIELVDKLRNATPTQINNWVDQNVTTLAQARAVIKAIMKHLATRT